MKTHSFFTAQRLNHNLFKLSYLGCGSVTEWNTEYAEECNHIRNVEKKVTVGGGAKGADLHNSEKEQNL